MLCSRCQTDNPPQAKFCLECAAPLARNCPGCGAVLPPAAKFCVECAHPVTGVEPTPGRTRFVSPQTYTPQHLAQKILTSRSALEGERKQVTVLFADLKGSMELLADRDPEEARKLLDPVLERMMEAVHRYEGTVNQVMGDGIMALFGAPVAHEDHAVRACYAALRMQELVARYAEEARRAHGVNVQIRVGLNSGEVVVRAIGSDLHMDYTAVGQTTHLAARLEQLASPGSILLDGSDAGAGGRLRRGEAARPGAGEGTGRSRGGLRGDGGGPGADPPAGGRPAGLDAVRRPRRRAGAAPPRAASSPAPGAVRWRRSWARRAWASRASSTSSPTRIACRAGWSSRVRRSRTARRRATCRSSTSSRATSRSRTATTSGRSARR